VVQYCDRTFVFFSLFFIFFLAVCILDIFGHLVGEDDKFN
jgi:hypothetical protein